MAINKIKTKTVKAVLTEKEYDPLNTAAKASNQSLSAFVRHILRMTFFKYTNELMEENDE